MLTRKGNNNAATSLVDRARAIWIQVPVAKASFAPPAWPKITRQLHRTRTTKEVDQQAHSTGTAAYLYRHRTRNFHAVSVRLGRHDATGITLFDLSSKLAAEVLYHAGRTRQTLEHAAEVPLHSGLLTSYQRCTVIAISRDPAGF